MLDPATIATFLAAYLKNSDHAGIDPLPAPELLAGLTDGEVMIAGARLKKTADNGSTRGILRPGPRQDLMA